MSGAPLQPPKNRFSEVAIDKDEFDEFQKEAYREEDETIERFLAQYRTGISKVSVYWIDPMTAKPRQLNHFTPEALNEDVIRKRYRTLLRNNGGVGDFQLRLLDEEGRYVRSRSISVLDVDLVDAAGQGLIPAVSNDGESGSVMERMLMFQVQQLQQESGRSHELMLEMVRSSSGGSGGGNIADLIQAVVSLNSVAKPPEDPLMKETMAALIKKGLTDTDKPADTVLGVVKEVASEFVKRLPGVPGVSGTQTVTAPSTVVRTLQPPVTNPANPSNGSGDNQANEGNAQMRALQILKERVDFLKSRARAGKDVGLFVDEVLENDDLEHNRIILQAVSQYRFEELYQLDAEIETDSVVNTWFRTFFDGVLDALRNQVDSSGEVRDTTNSADNGGTDPAGDVGPKDAANSTDNSGSVGVV
jgi:hypothetical protein